MSAHCTQYKMRCKANFLQVYLSEIFLLLPLFFLSPALICRAYVPPSGQCFPSLFSFGDSKADTGNAQAAFPFESLAEYPPYGRTFFGQPSDRYCDGRLVIDFQAQAYGLPLLSPYGRGLGSNFRHGANFAASDSGCIPDWANSSFYLARQFHQFRKLKSHYMEVQAKDKSYSPPSEYFGGGLYVISTGENDYRAGIFYKGLSAQDIKKQLVPRVIEIIYTTVKGLYEEGARKFMVVGIAADGCIPVLLTVVPHKMSRDLDTLGCLSSVNNYVQFHNRMLLEAVKKLRVEFPDANFAYGDYFGANIDILVNARTYGLVDTHKACCGHGGRYNFNIEVLCGQTGEVEGKRVSVSSCKDPSKFINWDGIHLTEHFYELVAKAFLQGHFVDQPPLLPSSCTLNFSTFSS